MSNTTINHQLTPINQMTTLEQIESLAKAYSDARAQLAERVSDLQAELAAAEKQHLLKIKRAVALCAGLHEDLHHLVADSKHLFEKPKTQIFHGIKCGYAKQVGSIAIEDEDHTVELIEKIYAGRKAMLELLIITKKKPSKEGIRDLPMAEAKKIGVEITESGEAVIVRPVDGAVEKQVKALLKNAIEEASE